MFECLGGFLSDRWGAVHPLLCACAPSAAANVQFLALDLRSLIPQAHGKGKHHIEAGGAEGIWGKDGNGIRTPGR